MDTTVILTAAVYAATLRRLAAPADDISMTLAISFLIESGYTLSSTYDLDVHGSSQRLFMHFTRALGGDPIEDPGIENVTFVDAAPVVV